MHYRTAKDRNGKILDGMWWCFGFDGEGCTAKIPPEACLRVWVGETRWPGITMKDQRIGSFEEADFQWRWDTAVDTALGK
jgi:hypothetical protein